MEKIKIKWDGITEIEKIMPALLGLITDEEQQQAKKMAYGDFAEIIRKKYRNRGTNSGGLFVDAFRDKIMVYAEKTTYFMTWNKAAKYICQWLKEENIMENQVITQNQEIIITENYSRAVSLHRRICANAQAAQESLFEVCKGLKEMRDGKLYKELGYQNFEDYTQTELGFSRRNAYSYIAIAENFSADFVNSSSQIGMKKLTLLAKLDEPERQEIIQNNDLESTSVKELKNKISDLKKANDRLLEKASQAEKNAEDSRKKESEAWGKVSVLKTDSEMQVKKISQLEKQIQELENRPVEVAVKDNSEEVERLKKQLEQEKQKSAEFEEKKKRIEAELEKDRNSFKSKTPDNSELFEVYYQNCLDSIDKLFAFMIKTDGSEKFMDKIYELSDYINSRIENID